MLAVYTISLQKKCSAIDVFKARINCFCYNLLDGSGDSVNIKIVFEFILVYVCK